MTLADLVHREYWTPTEAARVLGRGASFWVNQFDRGAVAGYRNGRGKRQISAESARALLRSFSGEVDTLAAARAAEADAWRRYRSK